ncbi:MAG: signal peptide peptidase SppA [Deltaproteobacteria bacterium]|nr:signal peptide peptidase SppA [Deltaproteobacteria bacterium]MBW2069959.1 signal peptide peptidase SppA [Deltaproteobacteria bacterium]
MQLRHARRKSVLGLWLVCFVFLGSGCTLVNVSLYQPARPLEEKVVEGKGPGKIVLIDVSGILTSRESSSLDLFRERASVVARVKEELDKAAEDEAVKVVVLRIHTPGGTVTASDLLHHEIIEFKRKTKAKVAAHLMGVATSGGYYVATAADYIAAQPTSITGSIGVIALQFNIQGLLEKIGVEGQSIKSGDKKDMWSPFRRLTPEERKILQDIINGYKDAFLEVVRNGRPSMTSQDLATVADGRLVSAKQALELHLVDKLAYLEDTLNWARSAAAVPEAKIVLYRRPGTYVDNIYSLSTMAEESWLRRLQQEAPWQQQADTPLFMYVWLP